MVKQKTQQAESFFPYHHKRITTVQLILKPAPQAKNCTGFALVNESKNHMNKQQWQRRIHAKVQKIQIIPTCHILYLLLTIYKKA
jgi:hypothetical protein